MNNSTSDVAIRTVRQEKLVAIVFGVESKLILPENNEKLNEDLITKLYTVTDLLSQSFDRMKDEKLKNFPDKTLFNRINELQNKLKENKEKGMKFIQEIKNNKLNPSQSKHDDDNQSTDIVLKITSESLKLLCEGFSIEDQLTVIEIYNSIKNIRRIIKATREASNGKDLNKIKQAYKLTFSAFSTKLKARCEELLSKISARNLTKYGDEIQKRFSIILKLIENLVESDLKDSSLLKSLEIEIMEALHCLLFLFTWLNLYIGEENADFSYFDLELASLVNVPQFWSICGYESTRCEIEQIKKTIERIRKNLIMIIDSDECLNSIESNLDKCLNDLKIIEKSNQNQSSSSTKLEKLTISKDLASEFEKRCLNINNELQKYKNDEVLMRIRNLSINRTKRSQESTKQIFNRHHDLRKDKKFQNFCQLDEFISQLEAIKKLLDLINKLQSSKNNDDEETKANLRKAQAELFEIYQKIFESKSKSQKETLLCLVNEIKKCGKDRKIFRDELNGEFSKALDDYVSHEKLFPFMANSILDENDLAKQKDQLNVLENSGRNLRILQMHCSSLQKIKNSIESRDEDLIKSLNELLTQCDSFESDLSSYGEIADNNKSQVSKYLSKIIDESNKYLNKNAKEKQLQEKAQKEREQQEEEARLRRIEEQERLAKSKNMATPEDIERYDKLPSNIELSKLPQDKGEIVDSARSLHDATQNFESNNNVIIENAKAIIAHMVKAQYQLNAKDMDGMLKTSSSLLSLIINLNKHCHILAQTPGLTKLLKNDLLAYSNAAENSARQLHILVSLNRNDFFQQLISEDKNSNNYLMDSLLLICNRMLGDVQKSLISAENSSLQRPNKEYPFERRKFTNFST